MVLITSDVTSDSRTAGITKLPEAGVQTSYVHSSKNSLYREHRCSIIKDGLDWGIAYVSLMTVEQLLITWMNVFIIKKITN